jgi:hypothetical protein
MAEKKNFFKKDQPPKDGQDQNQPDQNPQGTQEQPPTPQQNPQIQQPPQNETKQNKSWRAKVDCVYNGRRVKQGETVFAAEMKNANFEAAAKG